jgi:hypothetical protein
MPKLGPLSAYPDTTLHAVRTAVAALLRYEEMLPTDLSIKLDLFHGDIGEALRPSRPPTPVFLPHPAAQPGPLPSHGTPPRTQVPPRPTARRGSPPERHSQ